MELLMEHDLDFNRNINILLDKGNIYLSVGCCEEALYCFDEAIQICERMKGRDTWKAWISELIGDVYQHKGLLQTALEHYLRAEQLKQCTASANLGTVKLFEKIGDIYQSSGDCTKVSQCHKRSKRVLKKISREEVKADFNQIGILYHNIGDLDEACKFYKKALAEESKESQKAIYLCNLAILYEDEDELDKAIQCYNQALDILSRRGVMSDLAISCLKGLGRSHRWYHTPALVFKALCDLQKQHPEAAGFTEKEIRKRTGMFTEAMKYYINTADVIESIRPKMPRGSEGSIQYFTKQSSIYSSIIEILFQLGNSDSAFNYAERSRARAMSDLLSSQIIDFSLKVDPNILRKEQNLQLSLSRSYHDLMKQYAKKTRNQDLVNALKNNIRNVESEIKVVSEKIHAEYPSYGNLRYPRPLDIKGVRNQLLNSETLLIEYFVGEEESYLWAVTSDETKFLLIDISRAELERLVRSNFRSHLDDFSVKGKKAVIKASHRLWMLLLSPIQPLMEKYRHILISLDGPLNYIPFEALIYSVRKPAHDDDIYEGCSFVGERHTFTYIPSATVLLEILERKKQMVFSERGGDLIAFGNPIVEPKILKDISMSSPAVREYINRRKMIIKPLPGTELEIKWLFKVFTQIEPNENENTLKHGKTTCYLCDDINKNRIMNECGSYRFVHFATHGFIDDEFPLNSGLLLSLRSLGKNQAEATILQAYEIFGMRLNADLVTLSACQTGLGKIQKGEGVMGLTRAFLYAGASSVVASLWSVADENTAFLMKEFYKNINAGKHKDIALATARRSVMTKNKNPFYWAPFILQGDWL